MLASIMGGGGNMIGEAVGDAMKQAMDTLQKEDGMPRFLADEIKQMVDEKIDGMKDKDVDCECQQKVNDETQDWRQDFQNDLQKMITDMVRQALKEEVKKKKSGGSGGGTGTLGAEGAGATGGGGATGGAGGAEGAGSAGGGGDSGGALAGSFWTKRPDGNLYVIPGGTGEPVIVNRVLGIDSSSSFIVTRFGPRYLQVSHEGATRDVRAVINVYEHADHKPYCFVNIPGYVSTASVSPSGKYILVNRSPEFAFSTFALGSTSAITDLLIIDISDVNNIRDIRNSRTTGQAAIYKSTWLADDRFAYLTWGDGNFGDSMYMGSAVGGAAGDRLLGKIDKQGLRIQGLNIHPDESSMLLSMFDDDGRSLGFWDVYSYKLTGERIDRVTAVDQGYAGTYSPDGRHIFFKYGSSNSCSTTGCVVVCKPYYMASNLRSIGLSQAHLLDDAKLGCTWDTMWRS